MNPIVFHIISGQAFFTGATLIILAALFSLREDRIAKRAAVMAFLLGIIAMLLSSTAVPYWFYGVALVITLAWLCSVFKKKSRRVATVALIVVMVLAMGLEVPFHLTSVLKPVDVRQLTVIGDSVTAGLGDNETETWPHILAREHHIEVQDLSHVGDTIAAAQKRVVQTDIDSPVVLLEIGGNDLLGSTTTTQFEQSLEALLTELEAPHRQLIMLELPLPPFFHEYGRIQRTLAKKHDVQLIPKRVFLSIIAGTDSTLDSIHLSQAGHQNMADVVWSFLKSAYRTN